MVPTVSFTNPASAGNPLTIRVMDDSTVSRVLIEVDGVLINSNGSGSFSEPVVSEAIMGNQQELPFLLPMGRARWSMNGTHPWSFQEIPQAQAAVRRKGLRNYNVAPLAKKAPQASYDACRARPQRPVSRLLDPDGHQRARKASVGMARRVHYGENMTEMLRVSQVNDLVATEGGPDHP